MEQDERDDGFGELQGLRWIRPLGNRRAGDEADSVAAWLVIEIYNDGIIYK